MSSNFVRNRGKFLDNLKLWSLFSFREPPVLVFCLTHFEHEAAKTNKKKTNVDKMGAHGLSKWIKAQVKCG